MESEDANPEVDFASFHDRAEVRLLREMITISSVSGTEAALARHLVGQMTTLGYRARVDEVGNAIGEIGDPTGPTIVLLGHMDTVPGDLPVTTAGPLLYGRGSVDAKGPLAAMICAAARIAPYVRARIVVIGAVDEERESVGAHHAIGQYRPDAVVVGEPSGVDSVVIGYKGVFRFACDIRRPPTHSSSAEPKAIEVAVELWNEIRRWLAPVPGRPLFEQAIPALIRIDGDLAHTRLSISCRIPVGFDIEAFETRVRAALGDDEMVVQESTPAVRRPRTDLVARSLSAAIRRHGITPTTKVKLGTADMNVVAQAWPVPTATYGPGDSKLDHAADEHIDVREYLQAIDVLADALSEIAVEVDSHPAADEPPRMEVTVVSPAGVSAAGSTVHRTAVATRVAVSSDSKESQG